MICESSAPFGARSLKNPAESLDNGQRDAPKTHIASIPLFQPRRRTPVARISKLIPSPRPRTPNRCAPEFVYSSPASHSETYLSQMQQHSVTASPPNKTHPIQKHNVSPYTPASREEEEESTRSRIKNLGILWRLPPHNTQSYLDAQQCRTDQVAAAAALRTTRAR